MSLLIRSIVRRRYPHQLTNIIRTSTKAFSVAPIKFQKEKNQQSDLSIKSSSRGERTDVSTDVRPIGERIKENTKTVSYLGVIVIGVAVTGVMFLAILRELLSSSSPNSVYSEALDVCIHDPRVQDALGSPIKGFGEETRRRRRQHVAHSVYDRHSVPHMRMQFYIQGIRNKATVHLEKQMDTNRYRYLFVQLDHYPRTTIVLEDNRLAMDGAGAGAGADSTPIENFKF